MICPICLTNQLPSDEKEIDCCLDCSMTGRNFEFYLTNPVRHNLLSRIRELEQVASANVWPLGSGVFTLGIMLRDGRLVMAGSGFKQDGIRALHPAIPKLDMEWGAIVGQSQSSNEGSETLPDLYDDDGLVEAIEELVS